MTAPHLPTAVGHSAACRRHPSHALIPTSDVAVTRPLLSVFPPHGPVISMSFDEVALKPQPLPPLGDPIVAGAAAMSRRVAQLAIESHVRGERPDWVAEVIDDWCGTPWPRKWPWPGPASGPHPDPWHEVFGPHPEPWQVALGRGVGAVAFASVAARLGDEELQAVFFRGAEQLAEAAVSEG